jgi:hypothetical protein
LAGALSIVFAEDVGADVQGASLLFNLTNLSHQANSGNWQQTLAINKSSIG